MALTDGCLNVLWFANTYGIESEWTAGRIRELREKCDGWLQDPSRNDIVVLGQVRDLCDTALREKNFPAYYALTAKLKGLLPISEDTVIVSDQKQEFYEGMVAEAA